MYLWILTLTPFSTLSCSWKCAIDSLLALTVLSQCNKVLTFWCCELVLLQSYLHIKHIDYVPIIGLHLIRMTLVYTNCCNCTFYNSLDARNVTTPWKSSHFMFVIMLCLCWLYVWYLWLHIFELPICSMFETLYSTCTMGWYKG